MWSFRFGVSTHGTHLAHLLLHTREIINFFIAPTHTSNSVLISFTAIRRLDLMSILGRASFRHWRLCLGGQSNVCQSHLCHPFGRTNLSSDRADIDCLAAINIHQAFVCDDWLYFCLEKLNNTSVFLTYIHYDKNCFMKLFLRPKFYSQFEIIIALLT